MFLALNRNKRSACLDLKMESGREALLKLVARYDVLLEQFRPGVLERLGLAHQTLRATNPRLVVLRAHGVRAGWSAGPARRTRPQLPGARRRPRHDRSGRGGAAGAGVSARRHRRRALVRRRHPGRAPSPQRRRCDGRRRGGLADRRLDARELDGLRDLGLRAALRRPLVGARRRPAHRRARALRHVRHEGRTLRRASRRSSRSSGTRSAPGRDCSPT